MLELLCTTEELLGTSTLDEEFSAEFELGSPTDELLGTSTLELLNGRWELLQLGSMLELLTETGLPPSSPEQERVNVMANPRVAASAILAGFIVLSYI
jgi:hypothetical protein